MNHTPFRMGTIFAPAAGGAPTSVANVDSWSPVDAWAKVLSVLFVGVALRRARLHPLRKFLRSSGVSGRMRGREPRLTRTMMPGDFFLRARKTRPSSLIPGSRTAGAARGAVSPDRLVFSLSCAATLSPGLQSYMMRRPQDARCKQRYFCRSCSFFLDCMN